MDTVVIERRIVVGEVEVNGKGPRNAAAVALEIACGEVLSFDAEYDSVTFTLGARTYTVGVDTVKSPD